MKTLINTITYLNRLLVIPFLLFCLLGIIKSNNEFRYWATLLSVVLGFFQVISSLLILFCDVIKVKIEKDKLLIYHSLVLLYFITLIFVSGSNLIIDSKSIILYLLILVPVSLSIYFTFIVEKLYQKSKYKL